VIDATRWVRALCVPAMAAVLACVLPGCHKAGSEQASGTSTSTAAPALALSGRVVDAADVLDASRRRSLTALSERLEQDTKVQLVVATTHSLGGSEIKAYSLKLANAWGLGDRKRNDGLLLLVAPHERKVRIEVGRGLEGRLPDARCREIVDSMLPHFSAGDIPGAIALGAAKLDIAVRQTSASVH
jgi:uncharacterized protein